MSGAGSPELDVDGRGLRVVIVAGSWHDQITDGLIAGATRTLESAGADFSLVRVPGSFELPVVSKAALEAGADAVVALGVIIRGGTPHFEYVCDSVTAGLTRVALDESTPVGNGVLTCNTHAQAVERSGVPGSKEDKGAEAVVAALVTANALRALRDASRAAAVSAGDSAG
jgi:6,7-dimethyl-8-ribityllumazine synthase